MPRTAEAEIALQFQVPVRTSAVGFSRASHRTKGTHISDQHFQTNIFWLRVDWRFTSYLTNNRRFVQNGRPTETKNFLHSCKCVQRVGTCIQSRFQSHRVGSISYRARSMCGPSSLVRRASRVQNNHRLAVQLMQVQLSKLAVRGSTIIRTRTRIGCSIQ